MAKELTLTKKAVNVELLDQELRDEFGTLTAGLTRRGDKLIVHMTQAITATQQTQIQNLVDSHNASQKTIRQQLQDTRQSEINQARRDFTTPVDLANYTGQIRDLAARIRWLEQEIRDLRDL